MEYLKYQNITADTLIKTGSGVVAGIVVNSHTSGTIKLWDNTSAAGAVIVNTYTFPAGSSVVTFPKPLTFTTGLYADIGGTVDLTIVFK